MRIDPIAQRRRGCAGTRPIWKKAGPVAHWRWNPASAGVVWLVVAPFPSIPFPAFDRDDTLGRLPVCAQTIPRLLSCDLHPALATATRIGSRAPCDTISTALCP
ncbi:hypothetical protein GQ53DRAFT_753564 [Thozetella sp. PMI_491]|nr:hypothetical protein GQ53DRAFT_753564 [Thozetella sp. PMI_491]